MKPKVALIKDGKVKTVLGRGRMNADQIARCKELVAEGWDIDGFTVAKPTMAAKPDATPEVVKSATDSSVKVIAELPPYRYNEDEYRAYEFSDGKKVTRSLRSACNICRVSLVVCYCDEPCIVARDGRGSVRVYIERL